jgi:uncharacterized protein (TIGR02284 family)
MINSRLKKNIMSNTIEQTNDVLNDLVRINNDRIEGYTRAIKEISDKEPDLVNVFEQMKKQSDECSSDLKALIMNTGGTIASGSTTMGKIYRTWMDLRITFSGNDRKTVLESCEFGEDAAQRAYKMALDESDITSQARSLISSQKSELKNSHDEIKRLRDQQKAIA